MAPKHGGFYVNKEKIKLEKIKEKSVEKGYKNGEISDVDSYEYSSEDNSDLESFDSDSLSKYNLSYKSDSDNQALLQLDKHRSNLTNDTENNAKKITIMVKDDQNKNVKPEINYNLNKKKRKNDQEITHKKDETEPKNNMVQSKKVNYK
jgi:hypothetical protein